MVFAAFVRPSLSRLRETTSQHCVAFACTSLGRKATASDNRRPANAITSAKY